MSLDTAINVALTVWLLGSLLFLTAVEAFTVAKRVDTISARIQKLAAAVPLVRFLAIVVTVTLLIHFFASGL